LLQLKKKPGAGEILFALYCLILVWLVLFKFTFSFTDIPWFAGPRRVNFIPFYYDTDVGGFHLREVLMNAVIFIPFGIFLKMFDLPAGKIVLSGFLFSFSMELLQFVLAIGAGDVTDLITNTAGTAAGVCIYLLMRKIFADKARTDRIIQVTAAAFLVLFSVLALLLFLAN